MKTVFLFLCSSICNLSVSMHQNSALFLSTNFCNTTNSISLEVHMPYSMPGVNISWGTYFTPSINPKNILPTLKGIHRSHKCDLTQTIEQCKEAIQAGILELNTNQQLNPDIARLRKKKLTELYHALQTPEEHVQNMRCAVLASNRKNPFMLPELAAKIQGWNN